MTRKLRDDHQHAEGSNFGFADRAPDRCASKGSWLSATNASYGRSADQTPLPVFRFQCAQTERRRRQPAARPDRRGQGWHLSSYRAEGGAEVDLVVETDDRCYGIEIKSGRHVGPQDTRGLESLGEVMGRSKPSTKLLAYTGTSRQRFPSGAEAWPWREVLDLFLRLL